ncbi:MAG: HAD family hydrolase [Actinomycetota bacterium]|nr:HAD family hydrolase [Actinomycetota bacterium]
MSLRAVLFDVDFTLAKPGPELMPDGYVRCGERHGLALEAARYEDARDAALIDLKRHPDLDHDEEIWVAFTERIVVGMGGTQPVSHVVAVELTSRWQRHENFELYEDVMPVLDELRHAGLKIGLVSNSARDVRDFALHHALDIDAGISSFHHGKTKPHGSIFKAVLDLLEVEPTNAAMVGDTLEDDIEGALALGMQAVLVDRLGLHENYQPRIDDLFALPALLGLPTL